MGELGDKVLRVFELGDNHDFEGMGQFQADDCQLTMPGIELHGRKECEGYYRALWDAFPDGKHEILSVIDTGDSVVVEAHWSGHHTGSFRMPAGEMPPTGREVGFRLAAVNVHGHDGKIDNVRIYFDRLEFLTGLGLVPGPNGEAGG